MSHQLLLSLDKSIVALCLIASLIPYLSTTTVIAQRTSTTLFQPPSTLPPSPEKTLLSKRPTPTSPPTPQYKVVQQSGIPKGAVVVSGLPALECFTKDQSGTWISNRSLPTGLVWLPNVPWMEPGKTVHIDTDSHGIEFKNISFSNHTSNIHPYKSLLHTYSNKSGWSMVMPTSGHVDITGPTITWTATGPTDSSSYNLQMTVLWGCQNYNESDQRRSTSTTSGPSPLPETNSQLSLPAITNCSTGATSTQTWTTQRAVRTGFIMVPQYSCEGEQDWWNQTGLVWTFSASNDTKEGIAFDFPNFMAGPDDSHQLFTMAPNNTAISFTIPFYTGTPTGWPFSFHATTTAGAPSGIESYSIVASADFPCFSDDYANPVYQGAVPCRPKDPLFVTDTENWLYRNVDYSLRNYWSFSPTRTTPNAPNVPGPTEIFSPADALPKQLAWNTLNVHVDCSMAGECIKPGEINFCQADQNPYLPIWAYLALMAIANLHTQLKTVDDAILAASNEVEAYGLSFVSQFSPDTEKKQELLESQVVLLVMATVISVFAIFIPMANAGKVRNNIDLARARLANEADGKSHDLQRFPNFRPSFPRPVVPKAELRSDHDPPVPPNSDLERAMKSLRSGPDTNAPRAKDFAYPKDSPNRNPDLQRIDSPKKDEKDEKEFAKAPKIGRGEAAVLAGTIPGALLSSGQTLWAKYDPISVDVAYQGGVWSSFVSNITQDMRTQLEQTGNTVMMDPEMTDLLLAYLYGGTYISGGIQPTVLSSILRTDITARAINHLWNSYQIYVAFISLGDPPYGNSTPACDVHTAGPQVTKFCACGGVFYLYNLSGGKGAGSWRPPGQQGGKLQVSNVFFPGQGMPYGLDRFSGNDTRINITLNGATEGSARAWNATRMVRITSSQSLQLNENMFGMFTSTDLDDLKNTVGRLPGEWALPVCDQGKNTWGYDYMSDNPLRLKGLPCACGFQGNETANFMAAINLKDEDLFQLAYYCCEGSLLFPNKRHSWVSDNPNTGPGAEGLNGGIWPDDKPLYYGKFSYREWHNRDLHCHKGGKLKPCC